MVKIGLCIISFLLMSFLPFAALTEALKKKILFDNNFEMHFQREFWNVSFEMHFLGSNFGGAILKCIFQNSSFEVHFLREQFLIIVLGN